MASGIHRMMKKSLLRILITVVVIVTVTLFAGYLLPTAWKVERQVLIAAPPAAVFPYLNSLKKWREWTVWYAREPELATEYSGPDAGVGATSRWKSDDGRGAMMILESRPERRVDYQLLLGGGEIVVHGSLHLIPEDKASRVVWRAGGVSGGNPVERYLTWLFKFQTSRDFEQSLARLKERLERRD
jgi:uncharacterized protein YndB with AHSA1/START domain